MANEDENASPGKVSATLSAAADLAKAVPIYTDAVQPAAIEVGKSLHVVARAVNAALIPVEALVWGVDRIRDFVHDRVSTKLGNVPPEDVQEPKPHIAVPAIEALRYTGSESDLAELYANLLATAIDKVTAYRAHPGFVDMIKNMSPDEARIMAFLSKFHSQPIINIKAVTNSQGHFKLVHRHVSLVGFKAECLHPPLASTYLDNLCRLGLIEIPDGKYLTEDSLYSEIADHPSVKEKMEAASRLQIGKLEIDRLAVDLTDLGRQFVRVCVLDKSSQRRD